MFQNTGYEQIMDIGDSRLLFIDDHLVDEMKNLDFVLGRPELPREHLLPADQSWEEGRAGLWASLIHDGARFHLWYDAYAWDEHAGNIRQDTHCFCYAVSEDGVRFEKPALGLFEVAGSRANNVVMRGVNGPVFLDSHGPPERRYRALMEVHPKRGPENWEQTRGVAHQAPWMFYSPDGIHWRRPEHSFVKRWLGATQSVVWDDRIGRWVFYLRAHHPRKSGSHRCFCRAEVGADRLDRMLVLPKRPAPEGRLHPLTDELPLVLDVDEQDPIGAQFYVSNVFKYPGAQDVYVALPSVWYDRRQGEASDKIEVQILFSRDGIDWKRPDRTPIISPGVTGSETAGQIYVIPNPVLVGEELWVYYMGFVEDHFAAKRGEPIRKGSGRLSRAIWLRDRFRGLKTVGRGVGELVTRPFRFQGECLCLNLDAAAAGQARVAIKAADGTPLPGYTLEEARPVYGNGTSLTASWAHGTCVKTLAGQPVRLHLELQACTVYAFGFCGNG